MKTTQIYALGLTLLLLNACGWLPEKKEETAASAETPFTAIAPESDEQPAAAMTLPDFTQLVTQQSAAVVNIQASRQRRTARGNDSLPENDPFYEFFKRLQPHGNEGHSEDNSFGSGFVISPNGYIITNAHVLANMDHIKVVMNDRREYPATLIGTDTQSDIALLKIDAQNLPAVKIGRPQDLQVGEWVAAIGAPFGFDHSVTAGIVSAKGRSLPDENYTPFIQTDVAINPGNSGGPLFNLKGQVIGVNSQIYSQSGGFMGISFAIPIDVAMNVAEQLRTTGRVDRGRIGVVIQEVSYDLAKSFGLESANGALITQVLPDGPAADAGLKAGDIVLSVNDQAVKSSSDLPVLVGMMTPGTRLTLGLWRDGRIQNIEITLGSSNEQAAARSGNLAPHIGQGRSFTFAAGGLHLKESPEGVTVLAAVGPAQAAGLRAGDIILSADHKPIRNAQNFEEALNSNQTVALLVQRGEDKIFIALDLKRR